MNGLGARLALDYHFGRPMKPWVWILVNAALRTPNKGTPQRKFRGEPGDRRKDKAARPQETRLLRQYREHYT